MKNLFSAYSKFSFGRKIWLNLTVILAILALFTVLIILKVGSIETTGQTVLSHIEKMDVSKETTVKAVKSLDSDISSIEIYLAVALLLIIAVSVPLTMMLVRYFNDFRDKLNLVIGKTSHGVFSHRITQIKYKDDLGDLSWNFNEMIDQLEAFLKEISTSIEYAAVKKYYRKPISVGLHGMFIKGLKNVQNSTEAQEKSIKEVENQKEYLRRHIESILTEMGKFADGDLTVKVNAERNDDEISKLFAGFNKVVNNFKQIIISVIEAVHATASASAEISSSAEQMAAGAQEQSAQTSEVASAMEQMTKTIFLTTENSSHAADAAKNSGTIAKDGGKVVDETIAGMNHVAHVVKQSAETVEALGKSSDQIGEIIQVIDDIADQTNLLALNAAIEAARAGEQGRGFAVVADEVRKLAERTTKATKEIADMIKQIQKDTEGAVASMKAGTVEVEKGKQMADRAGESLKKIISGSNEVVDIITQVAAASEEQSATAEEISKNIEGINNVTQESASGVQQIAKASEDLNMLTINLQDLISRFKIEDSAAGFKGGHKVDFSSKKMLN